MTTYTARPVEPRVLKELRTADDAGRPMAPFTDDEGGAPLRCCLRRSEPGERIALVSYAPLRRYSADGHILGGRLVETVGDDAFRNAFDDPSVALVHVRAVEYGCFLYEVRRPSA